MPITSLANFQVEKLQILDIDGEVDKKLMPKLSNKEIKEMYELMFLTRIFDEKSLSLQRQGRLGTYAPNKGQEAAQIGSAFTLNKEDFVFPAFRENGVYLSRGMPPELLFLYWAGDERGMLIPKDVNMFTVAIPVSTQILHAVGYSWASKIKNKKQVTLTYFGDGATSKGDFHEAMNFAGVFKLPMVFICQNNQYAISVPVKEQTASKTIAQKAFAYGFHGIQVDGNDVFAVYKAVKEAVDNARKGLGPVLIECFTYRLGDHTTSDDAKKYRNEQELHEWMKKDPILRLEKYMIKNKIVDITYFKQVETKCRKKIDDSVKRSESYPKQPISDMFDYVYDKKDSRLNEELEYLKQFYE
ncbi:MAG: pyruvate dehydrogenase (acetyl-transferring) E1 component subunit alpha [Nanoarchaeota archaeon]